MRYLVIFCLTIFTSAAFASGGGGSYGGGTTSAPKRTIDTTYEAGKNIFNGRSDIYGDINFCIVDSATSEKVAVKRKSVKAYKRGTVNEFASSLYDCDNPEQQIVQQLSNSDMNLVLYYLNKRYKLKLEN